MTSVYRWTERLLLPSTTELKPPIIEFGVGVNQRAPLSGMRLPTGASGSYYRRFGSQQPYIAIRSDARCPELTLFHEWVHFLQDAAAQPLGELQAIEVSLRMFDSYLRSGEVPELTGANFDAVVDLQLAVLHAQFKGALEDALT